MHDGPRSNRRSRASRHRGADFNGYVVPDAPRWPDPPPAKTDPSHAHCRNFRRGSYVGEFLRNSPSSVGDTRLRVSTMSHHTTDHPTAAAEFIANTAKVRWHDAAIWGTRAKRDRASQSVPEWETLRDLASRIKLHTTSRLDEYLERFEV